MDETVDRNREPHRHELRKALPGKIKEVGRQNYWLRRHVQHMDLEELEHLNDLIEDLLKLHQPDQCRSDCEREGQKYEPSRRRR